MKNKGFTLIEMIGVVIIMALIILVVFPATMKLVRDNNSKKYENYYELVESAATLFANRRRDDLGGVDAENGCVDNVTIDNLIEEEFLKVYEDKDVTCGSPSTFNLSDIGIDSSKDYVDIRYRNNKGRITSEVSLICTKGRKVVYQKLIEKTGSCNAYVAEAKNSFYEQVSLLGGSSDDNQFYYLAGATTNNYLWYSGKMWRVVGYDKLNRTIKLVTDDPMSLISYDMASSSFLNSNIYVWLNNVFLSTLKNVDLFVQDASWNYTRVTNTNKPLETDVTTAKVGLLNPYEYNKIGGYLRKGNSWWLLSNYSDTNAWYVNASNNATNTVAPTFLGVRPSIVLKANLTYVSGTSGTLANPYKLIGDTSANPGTALNTRFAGEYVSFAGQTFRIVSTNEEYTRLVMDSNLSSVGTTIFDYIAEKYNSGTEVGKKLNDTWYGTLSSQNKNFLTTADFCTMVITPSTSQTTACPPTEVVNTLIGIPKIGDMFSTMIPSGEYWVLSNATPTNPSAIATNGSIVTKDIEGISAVRPVLNIVNTALIDGGNGTSTNPYTLR